MRFAARIRPIVSSCISSIIQRFFFVSAQTVLFLGNRNRFRYNEEKILFSVAKRKYRRYRPAGYKKRGRKKVLRGYELQTVLYRAAVPICFLFASIAALFLLLALSVNATPLRMFFLIISGAFGAMAGALLLRILLSRKFMSAYHSIRELRKMDPFQFEHYIANLFRKYGYKTKVTLASGDLGIDAEAWKNGKYSVIQCKRYAESQTIGSPEIQQFIGSMKIYNASQGFFVATTRFSIPAVNLAKQHNVELIDDERLAKMIGKAFPSQ